MSATHELLLEEVNALKIELSRAEASGDGHQAIKLKSELDDLMKKLQTSAHTLNESASLLND